MQAPPGEDSKQMGVTTDVGGRAGDPVPQSGRDAPNGSKGGGPENILVELLRKLSPLGSEEPEAIMDLFVRLDEIYELGLVEDRAFIMRILPLLSGSVLSFVGE
jgi:hypothetical protein